MQSPAAESPARESSVPWRAGFAKVDITPKEPVRMAGYGNRSRPSEGVDARLWVRCAALAYGSSNDAAHLLISVDTIGLPGSLSREIAGRLQEKHGIRRDRVVLASTHTHCAPDLISELSNIFSTPLSEEEREAGLRYRAQLAEAVIEAAAAALADLQPARLEHAVGEVTFAANRRVLTNGRWTGFGVQEDGPVDHSLGLLRVTGADGELRGVIYNYACHATTLGGDHYRINGDWPGFASDEIESRHDGAVAVAAIGCGADANPEPRGRLEHAVAHGRAIADEVDRVFADDMRAIDAPIESTFDHAALSFDLPTPEEVAQKLEDSDPRIRSLAKSLDEGYKRDGRLPATYPVPIQAWQFGDQLTMIFIGGEVVVDYALRLKRELDDDHLWVTAYANDVLGYIASERMRTEGGYEFDRSAVYYGLPGPWAAGSEDNLIAQIRDLLQSDVPQSPVSPDDAAATLKLSSDDFRVELVAAEPLVKDPINIDFGPDGRLWVVEMGDYPDGDRGGRIKFLEDTAGDGRYDKATVFLDGLSFPTGAFPWGDGVVITAAPDILFARDTDGDGKADDVRPLYTGFAIANPQHRINGFDYGLDHTLHLGGGDSSKEVTDVRTGETYNVTGHDLKIRPDNGTLELTSGRTQYIRSRDDWGRWFGNDNSHPMYHFPIDAAYLRRNPAASYSGGKQQLFDPPAAPPVFPVTSSAVRFNDLFAANRFTSACSSIIARSPRFDAEDKTAIFVCEPVHNLVHRGLLIPEGASFRSGRSSIEQDREFLASTDPWFRPVRCAIGPDGALWVVDMYREVIEHPKWIPEAWLKQLDVYAGSEQGRIYRVLPKQADVPLPGPLVDADNEHLIANLRSPIGPLRDLAGRLLIERLQDESSDTLDALSGLAKDATSPQGRVHALSILEVTGNLRESTLLNAFDDSSTGVLLVAVRLAEPRLKDSSKLLKRVSSLADHPDPHVVLAATLALGESEAAGAGEALARIAARDDLDGWGTTAVLSSATPHARRVLATLLENVASDPGRVSEEKLSLISGLLDTAVAGNQQVADLLQESLAQPPRDDSVLDAQLSLAVSVARSFARPKKDRTKDRDQAMSLIEPLYQQAVTIARDEEQSIARRLQALQLFGIGLGDAAGERQVLVELLSPTTPGEVQLRAVDALQRADAERFVSLLTDHWPAMTVSLRFHSLSKMLSRTAWTEQLLTALEQGMIQVNELPAATRQQLLQTGSRSMKVRAQRLLQSPASASEKQELIQAMLQKFVPGGDASHGAALYDKHCGACHKPDDSGRTIGPSLANLSDRSDRALVEAILDPNRAVEPQYRSYLIRTEDDEILVGAIESELGDTIVLASPDGTRTSVNRRRIAEMKDSGVSLMPEGIENVVSAEELQAIVRFVQQGLLR